MKGPDEKCQFPGANEFRQNLLGQRVRDRDGVVWACTRGGRHGHRWEQE